MHFRNWFLFCAVLGSPSRIVARFGGDDREHLALQRQTQIRNNYFSPTPRMSATSFIDEEAFAVCRHNMLAADSNGDHKLNAEEYSDFIALQSGDYVDLPFRDQHITFVMLFHSAACSTCVANGLGDQCCVGNRAHIPLAPSVDELQFLLILDYICPNVDIKLRSIIPMDHPAYPGANQPSSVPSTSPSQVPSNVPSRAPTTTPSFGPSLNPSVAPTHAPSDSPTNQPSMRPSSQPSLRPSSQPSQVPTAVPSSQPSVLPSRAPTDEPSVSPSVSPTASPSGSPSVATSKSPSFKPPSMKPSQHPSASPSKAVLNAPSTAPSPSPSHRPSAAPTVIASKVPSQMPSSFPSIIISGAPSKVPSSSPSGAPSSSPTLAPSMISSSQPSLTPSPEPSSIPTVAAPDLLCFSFAYTLENTGGFNADDILTRDNNTILDDLLFATRNVTITLLNETSPRRLLVSSRRAPPRRPERALEIALNDFFGEDEYFIHSIFELSSFMQVKQEPVYVERGLLLRRLVFYSDEFPPEIPNIADSPFCSGTDTCVVVSTTVCVVLEEGDDPVAIRQSLIDGFRDAINSGTFDEVLQQSS